MTDSPPTKKAESGHKISGKELRASLILPVLITLVIWGAGSLLFLITPGEFNTAVAIFTSFALLLSLLFWTRKAEKKLRLTAVVLAIPALVGISLGLIRGSVTDTLLGVGLTLLLLVLYRTLNTPFSFRMAYRQFQAGRLDNALELVNKAIAARPDFWESYQLRALIYLTRLDFSRAERSAREAIQRKPNAHPVYNTLGQIYLAQARFEKAEEVFEHGIRLDPKNAMYHYHLGLCRYRQEAFREAAEAFLAAIGGSLRFVEVELQAHYYLWRCLVALNEPNQAATVHEKMQNFSPGLAYLEAQLGDQPAYPHLALLMADAEDLSHQLEMEN